MAPGRFNDIDNNQKKKSIRLLGNLFSKSEEMIESKSFNFIDAITTVKKKSCEIPTVCETRKSDNKNIRKFQSIEVCAAKLAMMCSVG